MKNLCDRSIDDFPFVLHLADPIEFGFSKTFCLLFIIFFPFPTFLFPFVFLHFHSFYLSFLSLFPPLFSFFFWGGGFFFFFFFFSFFTLLFPFCFQSCTIAKGRPRGHLRHGAPSSSSSIIIVINNNNVGFFWAFG